MQTRAAACFAAQPPWQASLEPNRRKILQIFDDWSSLPAAVPSLGSDSERLGSAGAPFDTACDRVFPPQSRVKCYAKPSSCTGRQPTRDRKVKTFELDPNRIEAPLSAGQSARHFDFEAVAFKQI